MRRREVRERTEVDVGKGERKSARDKEKKNRGKEKKENSLLKLMMQITQFFPRGGKAAASAFEIRKEKARAL